MSVFDFIKYELATNNKDHARNSYKYFLFADFINDDDAVGSRNEHLRKDYTIDPIFYESMQYVNQLWRFSKTLLDTDNTLDFFDAIDKFEHLLQSIKSYRYKNFNPDYEVSHYEVIKSKIYTDFLSRSFRKEYRIAIERKTEKGRKNYMEHWFLKMEYYRQFMPEDAQVKYDEIKEQWTNGLPDKGQE